MEVEDEFEFDDFLLRFPEFVVDDEEEGLRDTSGEAEEVQTSSSSSWSWSRKGETEGEGTNWILKGDDLDLDLVAENWGDGL